MKSLSLRILVVCLLLGANSAMSEFEKSTHVILWSNFSPERSMALLDSLRKKGYVDDKYVDIDGIGFMGHNFAWRNGYLGKVDIKYQNDFKEYGKLLAVGNELFDSEGNVASRITISDFLEIVRGPGFKIPVIPSKSVMAQLNTIDFEAKRLAKEAAAGKDVAAKTSALEISLKAIEEKYGAMPELAAVLRDQRDRLDAIDNGFVNQARFNAMIESENNKTQNSLKALRKKVGEFASLKKEMEALKEQSRLNTLGLKTAKARADAADLERESLRSDVSANSNQIRVQGELIAQNNVVINDVKANNENYGNRFSRLELGGMIALVVILALFFIGGLLIQSGRKESKQTSRAAELKQETTDSDVKRLKDRVAGMEKAIEELKDVQPKISKEESVMDDSKPVSSDTIAMADSEPPVDPSRTFDDSDLFYLREHLKRNAS